MKKHLEIIGNNPLSGTINISGAKNSVLALMIGSTLTNQVVTLEDVPDIQDVYELLEILKYLGSNAILASQGDNKILTIENKNIEYKELVIPEVTTFRASYYFMGAMITRYKKCRLLLPGGCYLGPRPIDLHIKGLEKLGCKIEYSSLEDNVIIDISASEGLIGSSIFLDFPSVGATINLLLAAVMAEGVTTIENAAKEPEIIDVATLINNMGGNVKGAGTDEIKITGVKELSGCFHQVVPDRIEAGTYMMFGALLGDNLHIKNIIPKHLEALSSKLIQMGAELDIGDDSITISKGKEGLTSSDIKTGVFPSFATDLQQVFTTMLTQCNGTGSVIETVYPQRFNQCYELNKMNANIVIDEGKVSSEITVTGGTPLEGEEVYATDLRAGAALVFAGLIGEGTTIVTNISHILRGYDSIDTKLGKVGAKIKIVDCEE